VNGGHGPDGLDWLAGELSAIRRELVPADESRALVLALDQGGTSSRAVLFDAVGREVASAHAPIATQRVGEDRVEHDADELARSLLTAAADACDSPLAAGRPLQAAGLATQRSTVCCWDRTDGTALSPAISWQDRRNAAWLADTLGGRSAWVRELTGLPLSPHYGASKLRWCLEELAEVRLARRDGRLALGPLASFLLHRLCPERPLLVDPANASRTLLYDPALLDWSPALLDAFGVPAETLPQCVGTVHEFGTLALGPGSAQRVPLRTCSGDQSAAIFAFGAPDPATACVNAGTGVFVQRILRHASARAPRGLLESVVYADSADPGTALRSHEGTVNGGYAAVEWLARRTGLDPRRALAALSASGLAERAGLLFMNGIGGLAAPWWQAEFPSEFVGMPGRRTRSEAPADELEQLAAVVESIAFLVAVNLQAMQRVAPLRRIVITGGLAACDYLCEALAEVTGLPVVRPALREATARGIAWLAAGQPADWQPVPVEREFAPAAREPFRSRFAHWQGALEARVTR
jgi:glycerol kinase